MRSQKALPDPDREPGSQYRGSEGAPSHLPSQQVGIGREFDAGRDVHEVPVGNRWVWRGEVPPGTYHYAFVGADGKWFVPASVPGRRDDGMGGHVAVLVVAS